MTSLPLVIAAAAVAAVLLALLVRRRPAGYRPVGRLGSGDLCELQVAVRDQDRVVLKTPKVAGLDHLLDHEIAVLRDLRERAGETVYAKYLPEPVESLLRDGRRTNVFRWRDDYRSAEEILQRYPSGLDGRHLGWMFNRTLELLGFVHRAGWVHGAVLPPHLLFHADDHGLRLIDWIHAARIGEPLKIIPDRYADWYPSGDVALAAKSMIYLAGGDPVRNVMPKAVPPELRRFLEACLLDAPQDAWQLRVEFARVLEGLYGPPTFVPLVMT